jgi:hypothetical protein
MTDPNGIATTERLCAGEVSALPVEPPDEAWEDQHGGCWQAQCMECDWFGPRRPTEQLAALDIPPGPHELDGRAR